MDTNTFHDGSTPSSGMHSGCYNMHNFSRLISDNNFGCFTRTSEILAKVASPEFDLEDALLDGVYPLDMFSPSELDWAGQVGASLPAPTTSVADRSSSNTVPSVSFSGSSALLTQPARVMSTPALLSWSEAPLPMVALERHVSDPISTRKGRFELQTISGQVGYLSSSHLKNMRIAGHLSGTLSHNSIRLRANRNRVPKCLEAIRRGY
jgi:hypothetical protein